MRKYGQTPQEMEKKAATERLEDPDQDVWDALDGIPDDDSDGDERESDEETR